ncbi:hypothetical protein C0W38_05470 [Photobacterium angustum]|nr:hypothetical protein UA33_06040 [Photobacterium angustum]KJG20865.1 hypothetical protein UA39_18915 [Photobacterium angustum]KJG29265.1 hypothetical protein UA36_15655 [Photobacterium angustum]PSW95339.1 hypothetical protein C0W79_10740 [Photobacterium angustum]PSX04153.1 hypothetical protein C0W87_02445 [Photobacterium angustum]
MWAEMGTFLGGIYAPILGFLTLIVIYNQLKLQYESTQLQYETALFARQEITIDAVKRLAVELEAPCLSDGCRIIDFLIEQKANRSLEFKNSDSILLFNRYHWVINSLWGQVLADLDALRAGSKSSILYSQHYSTTRQRVTTHLSYERIDVLDWYVHKLKKATDSKRNKSTFYISERHF